MKTVSNVEIDRFMGDWFVIASIPTFAEKDAHNPTEHYTLNPDGTVKTTFRFRKGGPSGELKELNAKGFVQENQAIWGMQFIWPIKADYRIICLDQDYQVSMVGRNKRDYLWIMSRTQPMPEATLQKMITFAESVGYDSEKISLTSWQLDQISSDLPTNLEAC